MAGPTEIGWEQSELHATSEEYGPSGTDMMGDKDASVRG